MTDAIVITPVKDSISTTLRTIESVALAKGNFDYIIFDDFSKPETQIILEEKSKEFKFTLVKLESLTSNPSPNYKIILRFAQKIALENKSPLIIVESDVVIPSDTLTELVSISKKTKKPGLIGAITVDENGMYNFPYTFEKTKTNDLIKTNHSLSFCCTLISADFLKQYNFENLSEKKDWFDIYISRKSKKLGFNNYLAKKLEVLHLPHSSRPWKNLKYKNPLLYYLKKYFYHRDRI